jgi:hypothetical protein
MHYKPKFVFHSGYVANADSLMREFHRAQEVVSGVDQNNLKDLGVAGTLALTPSSNQNTTTFTHDTSLLITDPNPGNPEAMTTITTGSVKTVRGAWIPIYNGAGSSTPVSLEFTVQNAMFMVIIGQVEWKAAAGTSAAFLGIRLRLLIDGKPSNTIITVPAEQSGSDAYWSACVEECVFLQPGPHIIQMQGAEFRQNDSEIAYVNKRTILAMGFAR